MPCRPALGIESEGLELPLEELPEWSEDKLKILPVVRLFASLAALGLTRMIFLALEEPSHRWTALPSTSLWCERTYCRGSS